MRWAMPWKAVGIYRTVETMQNTIDKLKELKERYKRVRVADKSSVFNTDWLLHHRIGFPARCAPNQWRIQLFSVKSLAVRTSGSTVLKSAMM